jgi:hypothetical protein
MKRKNLNSLRKYEFPFTQMDTAPTVNTPIPTGNPLSSATGHNSPTIRLDRKKR